MDGRAKWRDNASLGRWGESLAADYLLARGYQILERNARTPYGEIDLVACQICPVDADVIPIVGDCFGGRTPPRNDIPYRVVIVFVEVKTRRSSAYGLPEAAITARKQTHLLNAAQSYLQTHPDLYGDWRIDVIAIRCTRAGTQPEVIHFENAITGF